jgi:predicted O-methyltransferase YrrM
MEDLKSRMRSLVGQDKVMFTSGVEPKEYHSIGAVPDSTYEFRVQMNRVDNSSKFFKEALFDAVILYEPKTIVELGVREGRSTDAFIRGLMSLGRGYLHSFDPANQANLEKHNLPADYEKWWTYYPLMGEDGWRLHAKDIGDVDLLFIDTDPHNYQQTKMWTEQYWINDMKPGSVIIWDDCAPQHQEGITGDGKAWDVGAQFGTLPAVMEYIDTHPDKIEYAFSVVNKESNGLLVMRMR